MASHFYLLKCFHKLLGFAHGPGFSNANGQRHNERQHGIGQDAAWHPRHGDFVSQRSQERLPWSRKMRPKWSEFLYESLAKGNGGLTILLLISSSNGFGTKNLDDFKAAIRPTVIYGKCWHLCGYQSIFLLLLLEVLTSESLTVRINTFCSTAYFRFSPHVPNSFGVHIPYMVSFPCIIFPTAQSLALLMANCPQNRWTSILNHYLVVS